MSAQSKEAALALLEQTRAEYLQDAREAAMRLGEQYDQVTIDDVRAVCPPPAGIDPRVMGAVFRDGMWKAVGFVSSTRATCHKRPVRLFALKHGRA